MEEMLLESLNNYQMFSDIMNHFDIELIESEVKLLNKKYQEQWKQLEKVYQDQNKTTYDRNAPYFNLEYLKDGDKVRSLIKGEDDLGIGTVKIKSVKPSGMDRFNLVVVHWQNGIIECYYPDQLERA